MLLRILAAERISPSYLFEGSDPETLREAALAFAAGILSGAPPRARDARIETLAKSARHPDLHMLTKDKATVISVKALTPVLERAHATPLECEHQVFIIEPAEAMEPEGIARYLKTLEEPPEGTVFLLLTTRPERLPDTVLSRCRRTRFPPLAPDLLIARLCTEDLSEEEAQRACRYAGGSLGIARRLHAAQIPDLATDLARAARDPMPRVESAAAEALSHLTREATSLAAADTVDTDTKRQHIRGLLGDLLRVLCVEARECAAGRPSALLEDLSMQDALSLLSGWGELSAAVATNVTPAAILIEALSVLRQLDRPAHPAR
jgi:hypothetical protein